MVQICVWFGRPLEKTRFVAKCKGKPWLGHVPDPRVVPASWHHFSILSVWGSKNRQRDLRTQESPTPGNSGRSTGEELVGLEPVDPAA